MYRKHYLLAFGGSLYGSEIWSTSVRLARPVEEDQADLMSGPQRDAILDALVADVSAFIGSSSFNNQTRLTWLKFNRINALGRYENGSVTHERELLGAAQVTGSSSAYLPPNLSVVATLETAKQRGPGSKGRCFLPVPGWSNVAFGSDGRMTPGARDEILSRFSTFITNLNNWPGLDLPNAPRVVVATKGGRGMPEGDNLPVTSVAVGRVVDTMRSRRNGLVEDYTRTAIS